MICFSDACFAGQRFCDWSSTTRWWRLPVRGLRSAAPAVTATALRQLRQLHRPPCRSRPRTIRSTKWRHPHQIIHSRRVNKLSIYLVASKHVFTGQTLKLATLQMGGRILRNSWLIKFSSRVNMNKLRAFQNKKYHLENHCSKV